MLPSNFGKTEIMMSSNREHQTDDSFISIGLNSKQTVNNYTFHGIKFDNILPFRDHVNIVLSIYHEIVHCLKHVCPYSDHLFINF